MVYSLSSIRKLVSSRRQLRAMRDTFHTESAYVSALMVLETICRDREGIRV